MFKKITGVFILVTAVLFTPDVDAQNKIVITRNGKPYIVVTRTPPRCDTPRLLPAPRPYRHINCDTYVRPFRHMRHINRFYHSRNHHRNRCICCIRYERWKHHQHRR